ncbi:hypothetical protein PUN28_002284 [Cardiocondyla obscurior]|uniref:Uncharacterized protein n=1 Tax=Cardiocondyla obscurior TaxID=286306 RepID=A0AAW2GTD6_9HYME
MAKTKNNVANNKEHSSASSYSSSSLSSDEEEVDARDLKPIRDYLSNRKELSRQLFKSVKPEKIRLMLPQVLKQMDLSELEEWCESELNGMSKARILSILNGKPMLESSDTSENSDDSGPSLEIISDTEDWLTDDDTSRKDNGGKGKLNKDKTKIKGKTQVSKKNNSSKFNVKTKCNIKTENNDKSEDVKIKKEDDKGKEGDSLLDLLELEMRARAIRALIRKEEDIIPSVTSSQANDSRAIENNTEASEDDKAKEHCRKQLERIISSQHNKGEDEDVVLVIPKPAPVVELLSSDSGGEDVQLNQELENKCTSKTEKSANNLNENAFKTLQNLKERKENQEVIEISSTNPVSNSSKSIMPVRNVDIKNNMLSISISANNVAERRKKSKKKSRGKLQLTTTVTNSSETRQTENINIIDIEKSSDESNIQSKINLSDKNKIVGEESHIKKVAEESKIEEERSTDIDDIDLDDYCEVMDIENSDEDKSQDKIIPSEQENKQPESGTILPKSDSTETWASRYYQTDDVQNVIKESKIQSEIRKRLRERQRLSKLNKSPNLNVSVQSMAAETTATFEKAPTGSVEEYLALKRSLNPNTNINNVPDAQVHCPSNININTLKDNSTIANSDNDIKVKEIEMQDENISSQKYTDADAQKAAISEIVTPKPAEIIADTENNTQVT